MELLLHLEKYDDQFHGSGLSKRDIEQIKSGLDFEGDKEISEKNIGPGADVIEKFH